ncbi:glycerol-3-phosphate dehydrogenase [Rhizobium sp. Leaf384]|uniref:NAD(P)H-dependent glycerol-3-phosphate dehydrogenase n=1 Tax=unclassified Rhizobium TaxID=2613769 RepID=UPI000713541E|nr:MULTISPECIES: NAD(P)H-dependent glycerol-3-phosphate dehydrogenase [unclassified Rhizobium]KQS76284.1 glycerol-3-phosphate dehydrogenase [Rhizobium sp. Leaf384]KQS78447.1 glycerol-3-phosphate dehydrogenase [Rhizobium sp. Leaf383]
MSDAAISSAGKVAVVGAGAFGTALAATIARAGRAEVLLIARRRDVADAILARRRHEDALPGIDLPQTLFATTDPAALSGAGIVLFAMPSQAQREAAQTLKPYLDPGADIVVCAKGLERGTGRLLTGVVADELGHHAVSVLSGPGFAADIAIGLPTAMVIAAASAEQAARLANALSGPTFRLYPSIDRTGVQLGGALKNVLAIACGIVEGAGLGESARAAMIARGLAELSRYVAACGGQGETVRGLSGLGDLVLTATSHQSRNLRYGIALGREGRAVTTTADLVEGALAASVAATEARRLGLDMPLTFAVAAMIDGAIDVGTALEQLMSRPITQE